MKNKHHGVVSLLFVIGIFFISSFNQMIYAKCTKEVTKGKVVKNEVISAGETQIVWNGGKTENVTVERGGRQLVYDGGKATGTKIKALGFQYVSDGGMAWKTIIEEKGVQFVDGMAPATVISGGVQLVNGLSVGSWIENGGVEIVCRGGSSLDTVINDGIQHVNSYAFRSVRDRNLKVNKNGIRNVYGTSYTISEATPDLCCIKIWE